MKNVIIIIITLFSVTSLLAQEFNDRFQLGVGGMSIVYPNGMSNTGYSLRANFGYFPTKKLSIGIMPFVGKVQEMTGLGANIYSRYYFSKKNFSWFMEGGVGFGNLSYESAPQFDGVMNAIIIGPGISYRINKVLGFEILVQYARLVNLTYPEYTFTGDTVIPTLGIQYYIKR